MRCPYTALVLATVVIGQAVAGAVRHAHFHAKKHAEPLEVEATVDKRDPSYDGKASISANGNGFNTRSSTILTSTDSTKLLSTMGFKAVGVNAVNNNGGAWVGTDGAYTNNFINDSADDLILVIWGPDGSWVNANQPHITHSLPVGASTTISFSSGSVGAWSAIYPDTIMSNGQISNTWGEYTFSPEGVVDVSREVNMDGHIMSIVGPNCTTDMSTCVFVCSSGTVCTTGYELLNCTAGSQPGAQYGTYGGAPSGGCGGMGSSAALKTTFS